MSSDNRRWGGIQRQDIWPVLGLVALVVFLFADILFRGRVLFQRDITSFNYPWLTAFSDALRSGDWPLWEPRMNFGRSLLVYPNVGALYPPTWLVAFMSVPSFVALTVAGHFLWAAMGAYMLGRSVRLSPSAAFLAAALWLCSGPLLSLGNLTNHLAGASWLPWSLFAALTALRSGAVFDAALWGLTVAMTFLAGSPEMAFCAALVGAGIAAARIQWRCAWAIENRAIMRSAVIAAFLALIIAAVQWLPTMELVKRSPRGQFSYEDRTFWSVHPALLSQLGLPVRLDRLPIAPTPKDVYFDSREGFLFSLYLGLPALSLFCAAFLTWRQPRTRWLMLLLLGSLLLALGRHAPVYQLAVTLMPPVRYFRYPVKALIPATLMWALLCGVGFEAWARLGRDARLRTPVLVSIPVLALIVSAVGLGIFCNMGAPGLVPRWLTDVQPPGIPLIAQLQAAANRLFFAAGMAFLALLAAWILVRSVAHAAVAWLLLLCVPIIESAVMNRSINATAPKEFFDKRPPILDALPAPRATRLYIVDYPSHRLHMLKTEPGHPVFKAEQAEWIQDAVDRSYLRCGISRAFGFAYSYHEEATRIDPLSQRQLSDLLFLAQDHPDFTRLLQLGAVDFVIARHDLEPAGLVLFARVPGYFRQAIRVYRVPNPLPKAFFVSGSRATRGESELAALLDPAFDFRREVLVADGPTTPPVADFKSQGQVTPIGTNRVAVEATLSHSGWLVFVETFDPNWRVTIDGVPSRFVRANVRFRAVALTAGHHRVEAEYRPVSVFVGASLSGLGLLLLLAITLHAGRQRRRA